MKELGEDGVKEGNENGRWKEEREEDRGKEGRKKDWVKTRLNQVRERGKARARNRGRKVR